MRNIPISDLKKSARKMLTNHHAFFAVMVLIVASLNMGLSYLVDYVAPNTAGLFNMILYFVGSIVTNIVYYLIFAGYMNMYLNLCRYRKIQMSDLWLAFSNHPEALATYAILQFIIHTIVSEGLYWIIPAIRTATGTSDRIELILVVVLALLLTIRLQLSLSMTIFLYCDDPYKSGMELILESIQITRPYRGKLFFLYASFIGVYLIALLSFGLGLMLVYPYLYTTLCLFYLGIKKTDN